MDPISKGIHNVVNMAVIFSYFNEGTKKKKSWIKAK